MRGLHGHFVAYVVTDVAPQDEESRGGSHTDDGNRAKPKPEAKRAARYHRAIIPPDPVNRAARLGVCPLGRREEDRYAGRHAAPVVRRRRGRSRTVLRLDFQEFLDHECLRDDGRVFARRSRRHGAQRSSTRAKTAKQRLSATRAQRAMQAMLQMQKLDINELRRVYAQ